MLERTAAEAADAAEAREDSFAAGAADVYFGSGEGESDGDAWFEGCEESSSSPPGSAEDPQAAAAARQEAADEAAFRAAKAQTVAMDRLGRIMKFATGGLCRHRALVEYFGQTLAEPGEDYNCGACDICLGELSVLEGGTVVAQKILSCIVRTGQRFGAAYVADVCRGANTVNVRNRGHKSLSTFGLLKEFDQRTLRSFVDQLVGLGFVKIAKGEYPTLYLSEEGGELMYGNRDINLIVVPQATAARAGSSSSTSKRGSRAKKMVELEPGRSDLFEHLRGFRRELARERGVPPYVIFTDRTLIAMANSSPKTLEEFASLPGVGAKKLEDLGELFLAELS
jgi:ATP-dependent DNA helicase RecQ